MPVDPRLNCAAEICCGPPPDSIETPTSQSVASFAAILADAGVPEDDAPKIAAKLRSMGVSLTSVELNAAIRAIAFG